MQIVAGFIGGAHTAVAEKAPPLSGFIGGAHTAVAEKVSDLSNVFEGKKKEMMEIVDIFLKAQIHQAIEGMVDDVPRRLKEGMEDPLMPRFASKAKDSMVDAIWPDIRQEVMWEIAVMIDGDEKKYDHQVTEAGRVDCIRAYFRYHVFPYDMTIWASLRDPFYWTILILSMIPVYGIFAWCYLLIFIMIDKSDEYQLVTFILRFKGSQFFSWGLIKAIVGFATYFSCATFPDTTAINIDDLVEASAENITIKTSSCEERGPGMNANYLVTLVSWVGMIILAWVAVALIPYSKEKGRSVLSGNLQTESLEDNKKKQEKSHGYIRAAVIWDSIFFLISAVLFVFIILLQPDPDAAAKVENSFMNPSWQVVQTLYMCQVLYGVSSIVFIPFQLPFLANVLTHAVPTAYDREGRCRKFKGPEVPPTDEEDNFKKKILERSKTATNELVTNLSSVAAGRSVDVDSLRQRLKKTQTYIQETGASLAPGQEVMAKAEPIGAPADGTPGDVEAPAPPAASTDL